MKYPLRIFVFLLLSVVLAACGGSGGSSSGGGSSDTSRFAGNYAGTFRLTASLLGEFVSETSRLFVAISPGGAVRFFVDGELGGESQINSGGAFSIRDSVSNAGLPMCVGVLVLRGRVDGNTLSGSVLSEGVTCNGVPATLFGTMKAEKTTNSRSVRASGTKTGIYQRLMDQLLD